MPEREQENVSVKKPSVGKKVAKEGVKAGAGVAAASAGAEMGKAAVGGMISNGAAAAGGLVDKALGAIMAPVKAVGGAVGKLVGTVAGGVSKAVSGVTGLFGAAAHTVAAVVSAVAVGTAAIVGGTAITTQTDQETAGAIFNEVIGDDADCKQISASSNPGDASSGSGASLTDPTVMKNAYVIYNSLTKWGMSDNEAIGVLCNMYHESALYSTMVQGHWASPEFGTTISNPVSFNGGVGLVQWTPTDAKQKLYDSRGSHNWYDLDYQISFILSSSDVNWKTTQSYTTKMASADAEECTRWFLKYWERCAGAKTASDHNSPGKAGTNYSNRWHSAGEDAEKMEVTIAECNATYGDDADANGMVDNILSSAEQISSDAVMNAEAGSACSFGSYDNSSAANAAVSYSWPTKAKSYNNGTLLYQTVYNNILHDRRYYKSCDRNVICAVAWSGTDDNFAKLGGVDGIYAYLESNDGKQKWSKVGVVGSGMTIDDCQPGDILLITASTRGTSHGHVVVFTGNPAITAVHGNSAPAGANVIAASYMDYSPCAQVWTDSTANNYSVYRCISPDHSTTYAGAGGSVGSIQNTDLSGDSDKDKNNSNKSDKNNKNNNKNNNKSNNKSNNKK